MIIAFGFLLLGVAALASLISNRVPWQAKAVLIITIAVWAVLVYVSLDSYKGYPANEDLPEKALVVSQIVREPNVVEHFEGEIILEIIPLKPTESTIGYDAAAGEPRLIRIPYTRELHRALQKASQTRGPKVIERNHQGKRAGKDAKQGPLSEYKVYNRPPEYEGK